MDYDRIYDQLEEVEGLRPLDREKLNLSVSDLGGGQSGRKDYSLINYEQTKFKFTVIYDFLKFVPKSHKVKVMINGLVRLCQQMLFAPANRRRLRFEEQEAQAKYWQSRLSKEDQGYITEADKLLARWGRQYLLQEQIRRRRLRLGLDVVDGERARWHTCERKKEILRKLATQLPSEAYEYFVARKEQYHIMREEAEDRAKSIPARDFSKLIEKIESGEVQPAEVIVNGPWAPGLSTRPLRWRCRRWTRRTPTGTTSASCRRPRPRPCSGGDGTAGAAGTVRRAATMLSITAADDVVGWVYDR